MQEEAAARVHFHHTLQPSNGLHTSNVTSHHFLGGQQHQSWMVPSQSPPSVEQDQLQSAMAGQAQQVNMIVTNLVSNGTSQGPLIGPRDKLGVQHQESNRGIEGAFDSGHHGTAQQNSSQIPPSKRPRLGTQSQRRGSTVSEGQSTSLYNFVSLPDQAVYSPTVHNSAMASPNRSAGPSSIYQGHATSQAPTPRRQSSLSNMSLVHTEMRHQQSAPPRRVATMSGGTLRPAQPPITAKRASTFMFLPRLQAAMINPQTRDVFKDWALQRLTLLENACKTEDWFYLTLHQIYCWRTLNRAVMDQLGFAGMRELQLANLDAILLPNTKLQFQALEWFSQFPTDQKHILQGSSPDALNALMLIHPFLDKMSLHWSQIHMSCLSRRYPPSPYELYERLGMSSTVLQSVFFTFIFRQIEGGDDRDWIDRATQFFKFTQSQLIEKFHRISQGLPETLPNNDVGLAEFARDYFSLRSQCANRPVFTGNANSAQSTAQAAATMPLAGPDQPPVPTNFAPVPSPQAVTPKSRNLSNSIPPTCNAQTPASVISAGVSSEVATNTLERKIAESQPASSNNTQSTMGPRQQDFMREMTSVHTVRDAPVPNVVQGSSDFSIGPAPSTPVLGGLGNVRNFSTDNRLPPGLIPVNANGRPKATSNIISMTQQIKSIPQKTTRLLPPAGKLMTQNTHPNPDLLALHQARLFSPEPLVPKFGENSQESSRLFQVFQRFVLDPQPITNQQSYYKWQFTIPEVAISRTVHDVIVEEQANRPAAKVKREFQKGSLAYRLRCIELTSGLNEADWSTEPTYWPTCCFVSLNDNEIELRRKSHWGKNLACDLTRSVRAGINTIEVSVNFVPEESIHTYAIAIELIEVLDELQCTQQLSLMEQPQSLAAIVASLNTTSDDDDVTIVDPHISIDLIDPFSAQIWKIPVRGKTCTHRECFDLQAFLDSRPNKHRGTSLSGADSWKCPICNKDARPQCLVLDGFLQSVSEKLRADTNKREEVRAIQVTADGVWKSVQVKKHDARRETNNRDELANMTSARSTPSVNASKETVLREVRQEPVVIIDLDDG